MAFNGDDGSLVDRFEVAKPDYAQIAENQAKIAAEITEDNNHAQKSDSKTGLIKNTATASKDAGDSRDAKAEREAKQTAADILFASLLNDLNDLNDKIAEYERTMDALERTIAQLNAGEIEINQAMERQEVITAIRDWEQRTGRKYDPERDGDAALLTTILGEHHSQVAADTVLHKHEAERITQRIQTEIDPNFENDPVKVRAKAAELTERYSAADTIVHTTETEVIEVDAETVKDEFSNDESSEGQKIDEEIDEFEDFFVEESALDLVDGLAKSDFSKSASLQEAPNAPSNEPLPVMNNENGLSSPSNPRTAG